MAETPVFGIDLGTTNSVIAVWKNGAPEVISDGSTQNMTPSCVAFTPNGIAVGNLALGQITGNQKNTILKVKRVIGKKIAAIEKERLLLPCSITKGDDDKPKYQVLFEGKPKQFHPEEVSAIVLKTLKENAEKCIEQKVSKKEFDT